MQALLLGVLAGTAKAAPEGSRGHRPGCLDCAPASPYLGTCAPCFAGLRAVGSNAPVVVEFDGRQPASGLDSSTVCTTQGGATCAVPVSTSSRGRPHR